MIAQIGIGHAMRGQLREKKTCSLSRTSYTAGTLSPHIGQILRVCLRISAKRLLLPLFVEEHRQTGTPLHSLLRTLLNTDYTRLREVPSDGEKGLLPSLTFGLIVLCGKRWQRLKWYKPFQALPYFVQRNLSG